MKLALNLKSDGFPRMLSAYFCPAPDIRIFMRMFSSDSSKGFSLIEMLVVISIVLLLSGLTLGALRASRTHQVIDQAAAKLVMLVELAKGVAVSEREPVYLVIADLGAAPKGAPMRSYTLIKDLDDPQLLHHWQFLPKDVVFAEDASTPSLDLISESDPPIRLIENAFIDNVEESIVSGKLRVLLEIRPEGTFLSGETREAKMVTLLLERGYWTADAALNSHYAKDLEAPNDQIRIEFRPLSGVMNVTQVAE